MFSADLFGDQHFSLDARFQAQILFLRLLTKKRFQSWHKNKENYLSREDEDKFRLETLCVLLAGDCFGAGRWNVYFYDKCKLRKCLGDLNDLLSDSDKSFHSWQVCWVGMSEAPLKLHRFFSLINESTEQQVRGCLMVMSVFWLVKTSIPMTFSFVDACDSRRQSFGCQGVRLTSWNVALMIGIYHNLVSNITMYKIQGQWPSQHDFMFRQSIFDF